jgi:glycosyltransferase involved in cell wall biosynthesis
MQHNPELARPELARAEHDADRADPQVAIVLPVFKHSVLFDEAIRSALAQQTALDYRIVIVNDGCPFEETHEAALEHARAHPERVVYLRQRNGGLSAARNTGIDFALKTWPGLQAVYLLDADNRLYPHALQRAWDTLMADPLAGWAYPDVDMFGAEINVCTGGTYSVLKHLFENYCEAGSLVRAEMCRSGMRFDESMKLGFEDWDFWLQAVEAGWVGRHVPSMGLQYRKRPESMLSNSERDRAEILSYMRRKHKALYNRGAILALEQREAPRYGIFFGNANEVLLTTDPLDVGETLRWQDFIDRFMQSWAEPQHAYCPNFLVFTTSEFLFALDDIKLLHWTLWRLEDALQSGASIAGVMLDPGDGTGKLRIETAPAGTRQELVRQAKLIMMPRRVLQECIADGSASWLSSIAENKPLPPTAILSVKADREAMREVPAVGAVSILLRAFFEARDLHHAGYQYTKGRWRPVESIPRSDLFFAAREILKVRTLVPFVPKSTGDRHIGFVLPLVSFGGVEKVALNLARAVAAQGWHPHLFVMASPQIDGIEELRQVFETINFLDDPDCGRYDPSTRYFGTGFSSWVREGNHRRALGLMMAMDAVVNCHSVEAHALMAELRRAGIMTLAHLHLVDRGKLSEPTGVPYQVIAYEHSYQGILVISRQLYDWCRAMGVPEGKLVYVPNAPAYTLDDEAVARIRAVRETRRGPALRIAFVGRLDRQKGLDRLQALVNLSLDTLPEVQWRIVGGTVLGDEASEAAAELLAPYMHPVARTPEELTEHLAWADVLVMPSYFEGVPLILLEAMRLGVVPIATRVGAVHEVIEDGETGFLVRDGALHSVVGDMLRRLVQLGRERPRLQAMSAAAAARSEGRVWERAADALAGALERLARRGAVNPAGEAAPPLHDTETNPPKERQPTEQQPIGRQKELLP